MTPTAETVVVDPKNTDRIYVGTQVGPYVSEDGGDNWTKLTNGLPGGDVGKISLGISPQQPHQRPPESAL